MFADTKIKYLSCNLLLLLSLLAGTFLTGCNKKEADDTKAPSAPAAKNASPQPGGVVGGAPADPAKELQQMQNEKKGG